MTLQCVIMFSICLLSCAQHRSSRRSHFSHSSPLTAFTISHFSKLFSQRILTFSPLRAHLFFLFLFFPLPLPPLHLILLLAFLSFHSPASTLTHSSSESVFHPLLIFLTLAFMSPILLLPVALFHPLFLPASLDLCLPSVSPVLQLLSLPLLLLYFSIRLALFLSFLLSPSLYHLLPLLDSLPSLLYFPCSVYSLVSLLLCPHLCVSASLFVLSSL